MTIEELFGTLQMSVVSGWRKHLRTAKYGKHKALQEFYEEMPDKVDALIEGWMGAHGKKIGAFQNILSASNMNTLKYLQELKRVCKEGYDLMDEHEELEGLLDDIVNLINSTLYKVKELSESHMIDLSDFVNEALLMEAKMVEVDPNLNVTFNAKTNEYIVHYVDKKGINYEAVADDFDSKTYASKIADIKFGKGSYNLIQKPWQDKLIKWVKQHKVNESLAFEAKKVELDFEDVLWAIEKCSEDLNWYKELRRNTVDDVLEYYTIYYALERELGVDEDTIRDFVADHEDELRERLEDL